MSHTQYHFININKVPSKNTSHQIDKALTKCHKLTGMCSVGAPPKNEEKSSAFRVALIKINLKSGLRGRRSFNTIRRKSGTNSASGKTWSVH